MTYSNFSVDKGAPLDFYVCDKDFRHDDHELVFDGMFPLEVQDPDFHAECRWLPNSELGPAISLARENAKVAMDPFGRPAPHSNTWPRSSGGPITELKRWVVAHDTATAESTGKPATAGDDVPVSRDGLRAPGRATANASWPQSLVRLFRYAGTAMSALSVTPTHVTKGPFMVGLLFNTSLHAA